jgi:hypothetical protein
MERFCMVPPFDIFKVDSTDAVVWIEAASALEAAKVRVQQLMAVSPYEYLIFSQQTGSRIAIKPVNGDTDALVHSGKSAGKNPRT